jgi:hypothetical protein
VNEPVFSLDLDETPAAINPVEPVPATVVEVLPLDAVETPKPPNAAPVAVEEIFSLDADAIVAAEVLPEEEAIVAEVLPEPEPQPPSPAKLTAPTPAGSGSIAAPPARPPFGSGSSASMPALADANGSAKSAARRRPAVKITIVKPGEKSPFAK